MSGRSFSGLFFFYSLPIMEKLSAEKLISQDMRDNWYFYVNGISLLNGDKITKQVSVIFISNGPGLYQMNQVFFQVQYHVCTSSIIKLLDSRYVFNICFQFDAAVQAVFARLISSRVFTVLI